ncbi:MAG: hypothetical protein VKJ24_10365 [Synechococcales bacterium]|nr:hypothetical protein [Synechococcales bacterium]
MPNLSFQVPADVTFEQAIALTKDLLAANTSEELLEKAIAALLQTQNGVRGFLVTFLGSDAFSQGTDFSADPRWQAVLRGMRSHPAGIADLMTKNLVMPAAMAITHQRNQNLELAESSAATQARSQQVIQQLNLAAIYEKLGQMQASLKKNSGEYQDFLDRWGYDAEQKSVMLQAIATVLPHEFTQ